MGSDQSFYSRFSPSPYYERGPCRECERRKFEELNGQTSTVTVPNRLNFRVAKEACDRSTPLRAFYVKMLERGLKTLEFDQI